VEDIAISPSDGTAFFANRLGGSTIIAYRPDTGIWNEFETGGWPTAVDVDPGLNRLYVLSHYSGTVSAYDLSTTPLTPTFLASVSLGLADTKDAISNQVVDATNHRVITTHPEHDSIVVVDGENLNVVATITDVPSFTYGANVQGRGHLQPAVDEVLNKLYVLVPRARKVDVFDGNDGYTYLRTIDLGAQPWQWNSDFNDFLVWADSARHRLYVGPLVIDTLTDTYVATIPAGAGQVVVGVDETNNLLYTIGVASVSARRGTASIRGPRASLARATSAEMLRLYSLDRDTYAVETQTDLRPPTYVPPYTALDVTRGRFYAGYMQPAEVDIYTLDGSAPTTSPTPAPTPTPTPSPTATPAISPCVGGPLATRGGDSRMPCATYVPVMLKGQVVEVPVFHGTSRPPLRLRRGQVPPSGFPGPKP